jgi:hypothetical protein
MKVFKRRKLAAAYPGARTAWLESNGDAAAAEAAVLADPKKYGFDPMTIMVIIQIIGLLWQLWQKHKVTNPPATFGEFEADTTMNAFEGITFDHDDDDE